MQENFGVFFFIPYKKDGQAVDKGSALCVSVGCRKCRAACLACAQCLESARDCCSEKGSPTISVSLVFSFGVHTKGVMRQHASEGFLEGS